MKLPELKDIPKIIQDDLAPCLNEHTAHLDNPEGILDIKPKAWVTCGDETIAQYEFSPELLGKEELPLFFKAALSLHGINCWREIARMLLSQ